MKTPPAASHAINHSCCSVIFFLFWFYNIPNQRIVIFFGINPYRISIVPVPFFAMGLHYLIIAFYENSLVCFDNNTIALSGRQI